MKIFIDPGHGGTDPGASGHGLKEKDVVLDLALALAKQLEAYNCQIKLARDKDIYLSLGERTKLANDWGADLYFSIHINGHSNVEANGYEDFTYPNVSQTTTNIRNAIHAEVAPVWTSAGRANRGMKTANFQVLRETRMPAVLLENGFITNARDAELLKDPAFRGRLVEAMAKGIAAALNLKRKEPKTGTLILHPARATVAQAQEWGRRNNAPQDFIDLASLYWQIAPERAGVDPAVAYVQFAHETGFLYRDGNSMAGIDAIYHNPCGLKTTQGGSNTDPNAHQRFASWEDGITAHIDHLALYAGAPGYPRADTPDPRHFSFITGTAKTVEELGGKWAPSPTYGERLVSMLKSLLATEVPMPQPAENTIKIKIDGSYSRIQFDEEAREIIIEI